DERRDHPGAERTFLPHPPAPPRNRPNFEGIARGPGPPPRDHRPHAPTPEPATRLQADRRDRAAAQPLDQIGPTRPVVTHRRALLLGQHDDVQTILGDINSAKRKHLRIPSLLMRARALATVRVWK